MEFWGVYYAASTETGTGFREGKADYVCQVFFGL